MPTQTPGPMLDGRAALRAVFKKAPEAFGPTAQGFHYRPSGVIPCPIESMGFETPVGMSFELTFPRIFDPQWKLTVVSPGITETQSHQSIHEGTTISEVSVALARELRRSGNTGLAALASELTDSAPEEPGVPQPLLESAGAPTCAPQ